MIYEYSYQDGFWYKYCTERNTAYLLNKNKIIEKKIVLGVNIEFVENSTIMMDYIINNAMNKKTPYLIPHKYYK